MGVQLGQPGPKGKRKKPTKKAILKKMDANAVAPENETEFQRNRRVVPYALKQFFFLPGNNYPMKENLAGVKK
jgi:hypothetical protein